MDLQRVTPIVPKFEKKKTITRDQFARETQLRFDRLQMQMNDLKLLIFDFLEQDED